MILGTRRSNEWFRRPPHTDLLTAEGLAPFDLDLGDDVDPRSLGPILRGSGLSVAVGVGGVQDAFHRLRMPVWLRRYFGLPPRFANDVGLTGSMLDGRVLLADSLVFPVPTALPMGFSWSLFYCQTLGEHLALRAGPFPSAPASGTGGSHWSSGAVPLTPGCGTTAMWATWVSSAWTRPR